METKEIFTEGEGESVTVSRTVTGLGAGGACAEDVKIMGIERTEETKGVKEGDSEEVCWSIERLDKKAMPVTNVDESAWMEEEGGPEVGRSENGLLTDCELLGASPSGGLLVAG